MNELAQLGPRMKNCDVDVDVDSDVANASAVISFVVSVPDLVVVVVAVSSLFGFGSEAAS